MALETVCLLGSSTYTAHESRLGAAHALDFDQINSYTHNG